MNIPVRSLVWAAVVAVAIGIILAAIMTFQALAGTERLEEQGAAADALLAAAVVASASIFSLAVVVSAALLAGSRGGRHE